LDGFILFALVIFDDLYFCAGGDGVTEGRIGGLGNEFHSRSGEPVADRFQDFKTEQQE
jgi:hypothetical protein